MDDDDTLQLELQGASAGDAEELGRALESCRDYLLVNDRRGNATAC